jgi:hypothetical protein
MSCDMRPVGRRRDGALGGRPVDVVVGLALAADCAPVLEREPWIADVVIDQRVERHLDEQ